MRVHLVIVVGLLAATAAAQSPQKSAAHAKAPQDALLAGIAAGTTTVVDLSYAINDHSPAWPGDDHPFTAKVIATPEKDGYFARSFCMLEHYETHLDAPAHFPPGKMTVDEIPARRLFGPAVVIDVRDEVEKNADYRLTAERVMEWEKVNGRIPAGAMVFLRTGWAERWPATVGRPDETRYRNMDANGVMHFPGYSVEAAKLLISRGVDAVGIDTLSIDYGPSKNFEVHRVDLPAGVFQLENVANLDKLPATGAFVIAAPIKLEGGSGGPVRILALVPKG
ncbi:MAG TPA: cyclase family protein [Verrucomicrobiae bacterium]|nr:cyclase family protein [Verrucomicrobiae bacterium]